LPFSDDETEEVDFAAVKEAFFGFEEEIVVTEFPKNEVGKAFQFVFCVRVDKDIVHVDDYSSVSDFFFEDGVHHGLEGGGGVGETKEHYGRFEKSFVGDKGCLPLVSVLDPYVVISPPYVYLGKVLGSFEFVEEVGDSRKWVSVSDGILVKLSVVLAGSEGAVFLFDEKERGGLGRNRVADVSFLQVVFDEGIELAIFSRGEAVDLLSLWLEARFEVDAMVPGSGSGESSRGFFVKEREMLMILAGDTFGQGSEILFGVFFGQLL
jgi:hypothetical protein